MPKLVSPKSVYQCQKQTVSTPVLRKIRKTKVNIISAVQSCLLQICRLWHMRHAIAPTSLSTCLKHQRHDKKSIPCLIKKASRCAGDSKSKTTLFLSFTFYITERSFEKIMCIYLLFHWFCGEYCIIFTFSLRKG